MSKAQQARISVFISLSKMAPFLVASSETVVEWRRYLALDTCCLIGAWKEVTTLQVMDIRGTNPFCISHTFHRRTGLDSSSRSGTVAPLPGIKAATALESPPVLAKMGTKLLRLLLVLLLISLVSARYKFRPRVVHPKVKGKGDYRILSRRTQHERLPWKPPYSRRG